MIQSQNEKYKPLNRKAYGSIPHLPDSRMGPSDHSCHVGQARIATEKVRNKHDVVIVQEKIDGSNCAVAFKDGALLPLSRAGYLASTSPYRQHHMFSEWVFENEERFRTVLKDGEQISGEWLAQAHGTRYNLEHEPFVIFDIFDKDRKRYAWLDVLEKTEQPRFQVPFSVSYGPAIAIKEAMSSLGTYGKHGALDPIEGVVWRVENKGKFDFMVKYVRPNKVDGEYLPELNGGEEYWNWRKT